MEEFDLESFTRYVIKLLKNINKNIRIENPDDKATFPITIVSNPMDNELIIDDDNSSIYTKYMISIENWSDTFYDSIKLDSEITLVLRKNNFLPIGNPINRKDEITKKFIFGHNYQVNYNKLTNSLERIK